MTIQIHSIEGAADLTTAVRVALAATLGGGRLVSMGPTAVGVELGDGRTFKITVEGFDLKRWRAMEENFLAEFDAEP
jgi:hypothetical protein